MKTKELLREEELAMVAGGADLRAPAEEIEPRPGLSTQGTKEHDEQILNSTFPTPRIDN